VGGVDLVDGAGRVHVLGALPARVVAEGVADLHVTYTVLGFAVAFIR
jgi:hypothetical protein